VLENQPILAQASEMSTGPSGTKKIQNKIEYIGDRGYPNTANITNY
jgi:hypothetical protein